MLGSIAGLSEMLIILSSLLRASLSRPGGSGHCSKMTQPEKLRLSIRSINPFMPESFFPAGPVNRSRWLS